MTPTPTHALLTDRPAIVTGGGSGIGEGIAHGLAAFGASVTILDLDAGAAEQAAAAIVAAGGSALAVHGDARTPDAIERALDATIERFGPARILVNNVGGVFAQPFLDSVEKGWHALLRANLDTVLLATRCVGRHMCDHGRGGSIVNVVSIEGARAAPAYAVYGAAKAAVISFTRTLAVELGPHDVRVNALAPDVCMTPGLRTLMPDDGEERFRRLIPLGRAGEPADVAGVAVFLASDLARYVTGAIIPVDGGTAAAGGWYRDADGRWVLGPSRD